MVRQPLLTVSMVGLLLGPDVHAQGRILSAHDSSELLASIATLRPGDVLQLDDAEYRVPTLHLAGVRGRSDAWITIRGAATRRSRIVGTSPRSNVLEIDDCSWLRIEDLDVTTDPGGVDGVKFTYDSTSAHIALDGCRIHDVAQGISSQAALLTDLDVHRCEISDTTDSGIYLGYDDPPRLAVGTTIRNCWLHDVGYGGTTGYGIQIKGHSRGARIENNVLHRAGGASRAAIATYYVDPAGDAPRVEWNEIRDNVVWDVPGTGIYVTNSAIVANNVVFDAADGIATSSYGGLVVDNLTLANNTVYRCREVGLSLGGFDHARTATITIANNAALMESPQAVALRMQSGPGQAAFIGNGGYGGVEGPISAGWTGCAPPATELLAARPGLAPPQLDLRPRSSSTLRDLGDPAYAPASDVDGHLRGPSPTTDSGAWIWRTAPPDWQLAPAFKRPLEDLLPLRQAGRWGRDTLSLRVQVDALPDAPFVVLVGVSGPNPDGPLPLLVDPWTEGAFVTPSVFQGYVGVLSPSGGRTCTLDLQPVPDLGPRTLYHAALILQPDGTTRTSAVTRIVVE